MKYLSKAQILESLDMLADFSQFFGFTFLAAKRAMLPVGSTNNNISLDKINDNFLKEYYTLDPRSNKYFRVFRLNARNKFWLTKNYASKGLQKLNTTTFSNAFIHTRNTTVWGWSNDYVDVLQELLNQQSGKKIPAFHMAVWLYRNKAWSEDKSQKNIIEYFCEEFNITKEEKSKLFDLSVASNIDERKAFQETPVPWQKIVDEYESPDDVGPEKGGVLAFLELVNVGPVSPLVFEPGRRLNIITGDNGLGKTFLLEAAWYSLTGEWADHDHAAHPNIKNYMIQKGKIKFKISGLRSGETQVTQYSKDKNEWTQIKDRKTIPGLVVYARVDGSYAVWDPISNITVKKGEKILSLDRKQVWDGDVGDVSLIEGLIRDWTKWQGNPQEYPFDMFLKVLECLSPPEIPKLIPGKTIRLPFDRREIPTIEHEYGNVPILHESAGIRHIITMAYLMVWVWNEHKVMSNQLGRKLENRMVVIIDEIEVHLHPRWQRSILPALLKVANILSSQLEMQLIIATHSPLVLASAEPIFEKGYDKLFHLEMLKNGKIKFNEMPFLKYGQVNSWLTSDIFSLKHPRSRKAEKLINRAVQLQEQEKPDINEIREVNSKLLELLPVEDDFWSRWIFFAEKYGVDL